MGRGFFHPDRGYWQTITVPSDNARKAYPDGTVEVPIRPSEWHEWDGSKWVHTPPNPTDILAEWRQTASITPTEFFIAAKRLGIITPKQALDAAKGTAPKIFIDIISQDPNTDEIEAQILFARMTVVEYTHPLISAIIEAGIVTAEQMDAVFGWTG